MQHWYYDEPTDETADWNRRVVMTEDMIMAEHRSFFVNQDEATQYELEQTDELFVREQVIEDWIICNWASRTDMAVGEYITYARR